MRLIAKNLRVPQLRFIRPSQLFALCSMFIFLLVPTHPLRGKTGIDQIDEAGVKRFYETFKVYTVLMPYSTDLGKASVWSTAETILEESRRHSLDPMLVLALINVESDFRCSAVSASGARGLMQIRPFVADALAENAEIQEGADSLEDPIVNIKLGTFYLGQLKGMFGDLKLALSAYNIGPTEVKKRIDEGDEIPLDYVNRVLALNRYYRKETGHAPIVLPMRRQAQSADSSWEHIT